MDKMWLERTAQIHLKNKKSQEKEWVLYVNIPGTALFS